MYRKLTTSDQNGLIIVWMLHRQMWFEEMINNRNKSVVKDMKWTCDGQKICIAYEDGAVIVGAVDGNRIWAKELGMRLTFVEWSPDGRMIIFGTEESQVFLYDHKGNRIAEIPLNDLLEDRPESSSSRRRSTKEKKRSEEDDDEEEDQEKMKGTRNGNKLVGIDWYDGSRGFSDMDAPDLMIAFANGRVQITRGVPSFLKKTPIISSKKSNKKKKEDESESPSIVDAASNTEEDASRVLIDTGMQLSSAAWNADGSVLALAGSHSQKLTNGDKRKSAMVQFYSPFGQHFRTLKVPGSKITALSWEGTGLRIALAVESCIYFATIRPEYRWSYFASTLCYSFTRPDRKDHSVVFWNLNANEKHAKHVKRLIAIRGHGNHCVLASRSQEVFKTSVHSDGTKIAVLRKYDLMVCDGIGSPVDSKFVSLEPAHLTMTEHFVIAANDVAVYIWQYRGSVSIAKTSKESGSFLTETSTNQDDTSSKAAKAGRERVFHIDADSHKSYLIGSALASESDKPMGKNATDLRHRLISILTQGTSDEIACITANERCLIVARVSGAIHKYVLPHGTLEQKYVVKCRPAKIALNADNTKLSIIDINAVLSVIKLDEDGKTLDFERRDAWDMLWADDNRDLLAVMEKTKLYVFRDAEPEEPVASSGYLCKHGGLQIMAAMMDEIIQHRNIPMNEMIVNFPTKSLRDVGEMLQTVKVEDTFAYVEDHPHPKLWRLLAEASLEQLEFAVAEKSFVKCSDYPGIQFVKDLKLLNDKMKQRAKVASYFERFDEAESIYREIDRRDLAIELRVMLGDWFRVVQLAQFGGAGDDELLRTAWKEIGHYYASRQKWNKAVQYFASAKNAEALVECYYRLEEYDSLEKLVRIIPESSPLLQDIAKKFQSVGLSDAACTAYLKAGNIKAAIDCCVLLNHWDQAVELAEEHEFPQIEGLLSKYASYLLEKGEKLQAIELYRKANKSTQAASLLASLAQEAAKTKVNWVDAKKLHVLAALEMDELKTRTLDTQLRTMGLTKATGEPEEDADADFELGRARRGSRTRANMTVAQATAATLETLVQHDAATGQNRSLDNAWKGAEACHLFMLAQRQLYAKKWEDSLITSLQLRAYEDTLDPRDIHSMIALTSFYNSAWGQCSKAFIGLESLQNPSCTNTDRKTFSNLALQLFRENRPIDPQNVIDIVVTIEKGRADKSPICMMSGRTILQNEASQVYKCRRCSRKMLEKHLVGINFCPLCHTMLV